MSQEAKVSPEQESQIRMVMAKLGYMRGGGGIHKGPSETNFVIDGKQVGTIAKTKESMVFSCEEGIAAEFKEIGLDFSEPKKRINFPSSDTQPTTS
jgi:hypothetical protein